MRIETAALLAITFGRGEDLGGEMIETPAFAEVSGNNIIIYSNVTPGEDLGPETSA